MSDHIIRIKPFDYIHVLDTNSNVTRVVTGPLTYTRKEHEQVVFGPMAMLMIPPRHYCIISNPLVRGEDKQPQLDEFGNAKLCFGDEEVRFTQDPFPLFPGEQLIGKISPLQVVAANAALRLRSTRDFTDGDTERIAGDEWLFVGPGTYFPKVEVQVVEVIRAIIIKENQALRIRARRDLKDKKDVSRFVGEEWLVRESGAYMPNVNEEIIRTVDSITLTDKKALHLRAKQTYTDVFGVERKAGQEWLVQFKDAETYLPDVYEDVVGEVKITTLNNRQYCVVLDPVEKGQTQFGKRLLRKGEDIFFLQPGERLEKGIQNVQVLDQEEALLLRALEVYEEDSDDGKVTHKPGDRWMIHGPTDYIPPVQVEILEKRRVIPLDENEGIYIRDLRTGRVRSVTGESYLLQSNEELWEKEMPPEVEQLLGRDQREKTRIVTYRAPHNSAVQIYDYREKKSRVVFGPELVMLGPDEHFTILSLSGGKPKVQDQIKSLSLLLGPDFMTDVVTVETSDHARLSLQLAYNWYFEVDKDSEKDAAKIFQVPDFVGDACKAIASRVRGAVAGSSFDDFHKHSADIIRSAVFGKDGESNIRNRLKFNANNLVITNIDIQSVEPIDQRTRDSLQKSVQLAIEITTQSQEATARHNAMRRDQEARGKLERQRIEDEAKAEKERTALLELQSTSAAVESTGQSTAEAKARVEALLIEADAAVKQSELRAKANRIKTEAEFEQLRNRQVAELDYQKKINILEVSKAAELADIEISKFKQTVDAIGPETIASIARAGPEMQAKLLKGLGLKGIMVTDGRSPINLFNTANGLLGGPVSQHQ